MSAKGLSPNRHRHASAALVGIALIFVAALLVATPRADAVRTCGGKPATISKGDGDNLIEGTTGRDVIVAGGGHDLIQGFEGRDYICGEDGNDLIQGNEGNNQFLSGGRGRDQIEGDDSDDLIRLGAGKDSGSITNHPLTGPYQAGAYGFAGNDDIAGATGDDELFGDEGNDALRGGAGTDTCDAGGQPGDTEDGCEGDPI